MCKLKTKILIISVSYLIPVLANAQLYRDAGAEQPGIIQDVPANFVELGKGSVSENFEQVSEGTISPDFEIPVYTPALQAELAGKTIKKVPRYNFGREQILKSKKFKWKTGKYKLIRGYKLAIQKAPKVLNQMKILKSIKLQTAKKNGVKLNEVNPNVVQDSDVSSIQFAAVENTEVEMRPLFLREPKDHELLAVDILYEEKDSCEEVVPVSQYLLDKKTGDMRVQFYRASCLHRAKLYSESIPLLSEVIGGGSPDFSKKAVDIILEGIPKGYEAVIAKSLASGSVYKKLNKKQKNKYNYILAKGYFINGEYEKAEKLASFVSSASYDYYDARFIMATSQYMSGLIPKGIKTLRALKTDYTRGTNLSQNAKFLTLINITLGRFLFERGAYKEAIAAYDQVSKNHPLWVDSLLEKGWAQVKLGDYSGAIGNMFTLHSPFFKDAFIPESYVIRTIGYLNLCQFGDAHNTLSILELGFPKAKAQVEAYIKREGSHYKTLTTYLESQDGNKEEFDNLPSPIVREMGRDRDYLEVQSKLNNIVDEIPLFKKLASDVMTHRRSLKKRIDQLAEDSKALRIKEAEALQANRPEMAKDYKSRRKSVFDEGTALQYRIATFDKGIIEYQKANGNAVKRAEMIRDDFLKKAEEKLRASMQNIEIRLQSVLRNNDLLRYEIYANSGKNIRFQVAGGEVGNEKRGPASGEKNEYNWTFKGEFWQDEIGNFRSDLKNLCPKNDAY